MKKSYIASAILFASCLFSFAQPVLNATDFPTDYSALIYTISNDQSLSPGNAGANQVWNFSAIVMPTQAERMITMIPVSTAPLNESHPSANYCMDLTFSFQSAHAYFYYELSSTGYELRGNFLEDWDVNYVLSNPEMIFQFPYTYNTVINDVYQVEGHDSTVFTSIYDAYGTLIMPYGTYNNVIRQKKTENGFDYYTFFTTNPFNIIATGSFSPNDSTSALFYNSTTALGVNEINNENLISIYPNPANTMLNLKMADDSSIHKIVITDLTGKMVLHQNQNTTLIDVQNLSGGMYIIQVFSENGKYQAKFIKE